MSTQPLDPDAIMAAHGDPNWDYRCEECRERWPCLPYRLAEALAAKEQQRHLWAVEAQTLRGHLGFTVDDGAV